VLGVRDALPLACQGTYFSAADSSSSEGGDSPLNASSKEELGLRVEELACTVSERGVLVLTFNQCTPLHGIRKISYLAGDGGEL